MFGIGIIVALGRRLVAATLADTGLLPTGYYRHLALEALEEEDFPQALTWLPFAQDQLLTQLLVLRLRLLAAKHDEQRQTVQELLSQNPPHSLRERIEALLEQENRALNLLGQYESQALDILRGGLGEHDSPTFPSNSPPNPVVSGKVFANPPGRREKNVASARK
jgi:hypothetical protein